MQLVGDLGWNSRSGSMVLFFVICCLLCTTCRSDSTICILKLDGTDYSCKGENVQQIIVEHGRNAKLVCSVHQCWSEQECHTRRYSDLDVLIDNKVVEQSKLQIRQPDALIMFTGTLPPAKYSYACRLRLGPGLGGTKIMQYLQYKVIWQTQLIIGSKPAEPRNFKCVSYDDENLVCTWEPVPNTLDTQFSLRFKDPKPIDGRISFTCPGSHSPNSCQWRPSQIPPSKLTAEYYTLVLEAENLLGKGEYTYRHHHWANVIPPTPLKISVVDTTSSSAQLQWNAPLFLRDFPPGMHYRVLYQCESDSLKTGHIIDITNETKSADVYLNIPDLEYDGATYNVKLYAKSSMAIGEDMWSKYGTTTFTTKSCPPAESISGCFEFVGDNANRDVYLHWREDPANVMNDESMYQVVGFSENGRRLSVKPNEITKGRAFFRGVGIDGWKFEITNTKCKKANGHKATIHVPSQSAVPQTPGVFTTVVLNGGAFELSWHQLSSSDITNYTIFWCEKDLYKPNECFGKLEWQHVPRDTNIYKITVPDSKKAYRFAIAANTAETSSGMIWFPEGTVPSDVVGKLHAVQPNSVYPDRIEVGWKLDYTGRIGAVDGFKVYYCPTSSPNTPSCIGKEMSTTIPGNPYTTSGIVSGLKPGTQYVLKVVVSSNKGEGLPSDDLYFTTEPALPILTNELNVFRTIISEFKESMALANENAKAFDQKLREMYALALTISDCTSEVTRLKATISTLEQSSTDIKDFVREMKARNAAVDRELEGINVIKSTVDDSATKVSDLSRRISELAQSSTGVKESIEDLKNQNEAVYNKLDGITVPDFKFTDIAEQVSNLTQTISTYKADLNVTSQENCDLRLNLTRCQKDLSRSTSTLDLEPH